MSMEEATVLNDLADSGSTGSGLEDDEAGFL